MATSQEIGFTHGNQAGGTHNYKPGHLNREQYDAGFQSGLAAYHEATRLQREQAAWLNQPKATRGPRPE